MDLRQFTDSQCGQSSPLVQMSAHVSQDNTFADRIGTLTPVSVEGNAMPPQSFKMKDLITEINVLESRQDSSIDINHFFSDRTTEADVGNSSFASHSREYHPQETHFYTQVPQAGYLPICLAPVLQPEQFQRKTSCPPQLKFPNYNRDKYKVIKSLDELVDAQDTLETYQAVQSSQEAEEKNDSVESDKLSPAEDFLKKGKEFKAKGSLTDAILCFKAALREDETCVEAWTLLGISFAENLQNYNASLVLNRALSLAPENLNAYMQLAVCSANQGNRDKSLAMLFSWLEHHPEYKDILPGNLSLDYGNNMQARTEDEVMKLFIKAAQRRPFNVDHEVQWALALICGFNREYGKAIDCIRAALQVRPNDARLWNRLGVLLCKNNQVEEGIDVFKYVSYLDPNFRLVHYSLAMLYDEKQNFREACKHLSILLNLQARVQGEVISSEHTSSGIWKHLLVLAIRKCDTDLQNVVKNKDLIELNKLFGLTTVNTI